MFFRQLPYLYLICAVLGLALVLSCNNDGDDDAADDDAADDDTADDDTGDDDTTPTEEQLRFTTYNMGLAHGYVPYATERLPELEEALQGLDADVLCLQEVWADEDIESVTQSAAAVYPESYLYDSTVEFEDIEDLPPACDDLTDLATCAMTHCSEVPSDEMMTCVVMNCGDELMALEPDCMTCLGANIDLSFEDIIATCTSPGGPAVQYEGANGLMLLSRTELSNTEYTELDYFLIVRRVLYASTETALGPVHVFCTHLTAGLAELPYNGEHESYEAEQMAQIQTLLAYVEEKAGGEPAVILGDFNTGPETDGVTAEFPDNYAALVAGGLLDPYLEQNPDQCTWCAGNPLTGADTVDNIIDHTFFKDFGEDTTFEASRILDQNIEIEVEGEPLETYLSDHYGVEVAATRPLPVE